MQTQAGEDLIERILAHPADGDLVGSAANDLLSELYAGYPVEKLTRLLHSGDDRILPTATWLLSELAELAAPLMDEVPPLLSSPIRTVRYDAIAVVLEIADERHGPIIAQVMNLSRDPESAVRWKVLDFLSEASVDQLEAGASSLPSGQIKELTEWLILQDTEEPDLPGIVIRLEEGDPVTRLFAAAAAASLSDKEDTNLLEHAAMVEEEEIRSFAQQRLSELREDGTG
ncbi:hypothetical protein [Nonomuraea basaltis]|uniref:hypothetical protein n=1 Tax=Nonomuraea basaltis TaxID=2495887 RepID=UPI00110C69FC|nr:hypothetical protein [Nonomuraea basaltis]TMR98697.1 hypothetical protein EJK15_11205 [Nonomuraea basaltis]